MFFIVLDLADSSEKREKTANSLCSIKKFIVTRFVRVGIGDKLLFGSKTISLQWSLHMRLFIGRRSLTILTNAMPRISFGKTFNGEQQRVRTFWTARRRLDFNEITLDQKCFSTFNIFVAGRYTVCSITN